MTIASLVRGVLLLTLVFGGTALAQKPDFNAAKKHYLDGKKAQNAGNWQVAVKEFVAAYDITKDPSLFKQIGAVYEAAGKKEEAAVYYRRYLNDAKGAKDADEIKARVAALEAKSGTPVGPPPGGKGPAPVGDLMMDDLGGWDGAGGEHHGATGAADSGASDATDAPPAPTFLSEGARWQRTTAWISLAVGAVLVTTGGVLGASAMARQDDVNRLLLSDQLGTPQRFQGAVRQDYEDATDEGAKLSKWAIYSFIGAGVAVGVATTFFILDAARARPRRGEVTPTARRAVIAPFAGATAAGVVAGWEF